MIYGIWLAILGILAVPGLIIAKKPEAKEWIDKLVPYQGWIGAISALVGAWGIINAVLTLSWLSLIPIFWITFLVGAALQLSLGLLLGVGILKTFIKDPTANDKLDETIKKLTPYQGMLGLAAIGLGIWMVVASFLWHV
jgi:hypothetical protein